MATTAPALASVSRNRHPAWHVFATIVVAMASCRRSAAVRAVLTLLVTIDLHCAWGSLDRGNSIGAQTVPARFQQSRTKGSRKPANGFCVTRRSRFRNPFPVLLRQVNKDPAAHAVAVGRFREWITSPDRAAPTSQSCAANSVVAIWDATASWTSPVTLTSCLNSSTWTDRSLHRTKQSAANLSIRVCDRFHFLRSAPLSQRPSASTGCCEALSYLDPSPVAASVR